MRASSSRRHFFVFLIVAVTGALSPSVDAQVVVDGKCNIYGSGFDTAPNPGGGGGGMLPVMVEVAAGTQALSIIASGGVSLNGSPSNFNGADGGTVYALTSVLSYNNLSGVRHGSRTMFLTGVFLGADAPVSPAPQTLDFGSGIGTGFASLSPQLQQVFFIGDGADDIGHGQVFYVPSGATRLFLGFADSFDGSTISGLPGFYDDNAGSLSVIVKTTTRVCGTADFNCDGDVGTDSDIESFFACLSGSCPALPCTNSADFNGDGDTGTDSDIEAFFRVLAGGSC